MAAQIHPTAIIEPQVQLGTDVVVGAYAYVGGAAVIGDGTVVHHHATVEGHTVLGRQCEVFPYAAIGTKTHDLKFRGGDPGLRVGDRNVFREYVTVHCATKDGGFTVLGDDNVILAYSHVAHDCVIGDHLVMSSQSALAGHVIAEDYVNIGWGTGVHQFCRLGAHAMLGGLAKVVQDVAPFMIADGNPAVIRSINKVGLERSNFSPAQIERVKHIYRILFREGLNRAQAIEKLQAHPEAASAEFQHLLAFSAASERGMMPGH
ncbi:MAG TPA: acyl-ACP--UDP-N-acetylglucosamine O-acyltransferase [Opitutaceae bacterium]|jgi:UDP-N-acetylglucosamine acyltransferase|nr:acyl-ACP--UDP-N-acetylglucosamine O-acyltransferase [Opitutaceae bacterium]